MRIRGFAPGTPCWVELASADPARAAEFYARLFGWEPAGDRFKLNGRAVAGLTRAGADRPAGWLTYLTEHNLEASIIRVTEAGGRMCTEPAEGRGGRAALIADPAGAVLGIWEPRDFTGAQVGGEPGTMTFPELLTDDAVAAANFYGQAFGWLLRDEYGSDGTRGEWITTAHDAMAGLAPSRGGSWWRAAFQVADCTETLEDCRAYGGTVVTGVSETGFGTYAELLDPWGAPFSIAAPAQIPIELTMQISPTAGMELTFGGY
ncbi:VOC family protein [Symbioplanes lichenis]|uniref:VOC family protein n=1 Tax=Symbioplanes lichenis TaxID=1629072 RepID=UPI002739447F|nr:VOC family protein [Actinoplanes lichenis]